MDKKSIVIVVLVALLGLVVGSVGMYIYYNNDEIGDSKKDNEKDTQVSDAEAKEIMSVIKQIDFIDNYGKNMVLDDISNQSLLEFAIDYILIDNPMSDITLEKVNKVTNKYFGIDIKPEDYICPIDQMPLYKYNSSTKKFEYYEGDENKWHGHDEGGISIYNFYLNGNKDGDIYTINVKKVFSESYTLGPGAYRYYSSYNDSMEDKNLIFEIDPEVDGEDVIKKKAMDNFDKLREYIYVFKKVNDNFVFQSLKF